MEISKNGPVVAQHCDAAAKDGLGMYFATKTRIEKLNFITKADGVNVNL